MASPEGEAPSPEGEAPSPEGEAPSHEGRSPRRVFVFNGDADGLCAQHILFLELGAPSLRVTGLKREIELLARLPSGTGGDVHAMDISLRRNLAALAPLLALSNVKVTWYDHHEPGEPPAHPSLELHVNQAPETCTSAIVNAVYGHRHPLWAAMAAFGDNLPDTAVALATAGGASSHEAQALRRAGTLLNYNAYGELPGDQLFPAADLAQRMEAFPSALDFCWEAAVFGPLSAQFEADLEGFRSLAPLVDRPGAKAYALPDAPFARRYAATWANELALERPDEALAVLHGLSGGGYRVSLRSPRNGGPPASDLAREFGGGGRKLAAGIDALPQGDLELFLNRFSEFFRHNS
jgi:hypothetical protein